MLIHLKPKTYKGVLWKTGHNAAFHQGLHCLLREHSGSVVECLTQDRGAAGSSLTGITVLGP